MADIVALDRPRDQFAEQAPPATRVRGYWQGLSLPYPEPGIRLIKKCAIDSFDRQMSEPTLLVSEFDTQARTDC